MEERFNQREKKAHEFYVEAREKHKRVRESERLYKVALILSWLFFIFCNIVVVFCFSEQQFKDEEP